MSISANICLHIPIGEVLALYQEESTIPLLAMALFSKIHLDVENDDELRARIEKASKLFDESLQECFKLREEIKK